MELPIRRIFEFIGSNFQDYFKVIVKRQNGSETVLL